MLSGGPYIVCSHVRHVQVVCLPPWPAEAAWPTSTWPGPSGCPLGHRIGGWVIHFPPDAERNIVNRLTAGGANGIQIEQKSGPRERPIAEAVANVFDSKL